MKKVNPTLVFRVQPHPMFAEYAVCEKCGSDVIFTGWIMDVPIDEGRYEHRCPKCKWVRRLLYKYPRLIEKWELRKGDLKK